MANRYALFAMSVARTSRSDADVSLAMPAVDFPHHVPLTDKLQPAQRQSTLDAFQPSASSAPTPSAPIKSVQPSSVASPPSSTPTASISTRLQASPVNPA